MAAAERAVEEVEVTGRENGDADTVYMEMRIKGRDGLVACLGFLQRETRSKHVLGGKP